MSNDPKANLEQMRKFLEYSRASKDNPDGGVIVDDILLSDWCSALSRAIEERDEATNG